MLGRNKPCHCKSGKKYKNCCLLDDEKFLRISEEYNNAINHLSNWDYFGKLVSKYLMLGERVHNVKLGRIMDSYESENFRLIQKVNDLEKKIQEYKNKDKCVVISERQREKFAKGIKFDEVLGSGKFHTTWSDEHILPFLFTAMSGKNSIPLSMDVNVYDWLKYHLLRIFDCESKLLLSIQFRLGAELKIIKNDDGDFVDSYKTHMERHIDEWNPRLLEAMEELKIQFLNATTQEEKNQKKSFTYKWLNDNNFSDLTESLDNLQVGLTMHNTVSTIEGEIYTFKGSHHALQTYVQLAMANIRGSFYNDSYINIEKNPKDIMEEVSRNSFWALNKGTKLHMWNTLSKEYHGVSNFRDTENWLNVFLSSLPIVFTGKNDFKTGEFYFNSTQTYTNQIANIFNKLSGSSVTNYVQNLVYKIEQIKSNKPKTYQKLVKQIRTIQSFYGELWKSMRTTSEQRHGVDFRFYEEFDEDKISSTAAEVRKQFVKIKESRYDSKSPKFYGPFNINNESGMALSTLITSAITEYIFRKGDKILTLNTKTWFSVAEKFLGIIRSEWVNHLDSTDAVDFFIKDTDGLVKSRREDYCIANNNTEPTFLDLAFSYGIGNQDGIGVNVTGILKLFSKFIEDTIYPQLDIDFGGVSTTQLRSKVERLLKDNGNAFESDFPILVSDYHNTNPACKVVMWGDRENNKSPLDIEHEEAKNKGGVLKVKGGKGLISLGVDNRDTRDNRHTKTRNGQYYYDGLIAMAKELLSNVSRDLTQHDSMEQLQIHTAAIVNTTLIASEIFGIVVNSNPTVPDVKDWYIEQ